MRLRKIPVLFVPRVLSAYYKLEQLQSLVIFVVELKYNRVHIRNKIVLYLPLPQASSKPSMLSWGCIPAGI
jgi:hypothetical protein